MSFHPAFSIFLLCFLSVGIVNCQNVYPYKQIRNAKATFYGDPDGFGSSGRNTKWKHISILVYRPLFSDLISKLLQVAPVGLETSYLLAMENILQLETFLSTKMVWDVAHVISRTISIISLAE